MMWLCDQWLTVGIQVHIALDKKTGTAKGFAFIQYSDPDSAEQAFIDRDGQTFQGRLIHILPGTAKREDKLNDFDVSKLPLKKQNEIKRKREAASSVFNWNALYMNTDAVISSVARRLGLAKVCRRSALPTHHLRCEARLAALRLEAY